MSDRVSFAPDAMDDVAADLRLHASGLERTSSEVAAALAHLRATSREFVPPLPDHAGAIIGHADGLRHLGSDVDDLAAAARAEDSRGGGAQAALARAGSFVAGGINALGKYGLARDLARRGAHAVRGGWARAQTWSMARRWGARPMPDIGAVRASFPGGRSVPRNGPGGARERQKAQYRENKRARRDLQRTQRSAAEGVRRATPVTRAGQQVQTFLTDTRAGRNLARGGRALGVAGVGLSGVNAVTAAVDGDVEGALTNGLATAGGAMMVFGGPVGVAAGATLTAGVIVYENWDTITDVGARGVEGAKDLGSSVVDGAKDFGGSVVDGAKDLFGGIF